LLLDPTIIDAWFGRQSTDPFGDTGHLPKRGTERADNVMPHGARAGRCLGAGYLPIIVKLLVVLR
jgi:hypothetical protein